MELIVMMEMTPDLAQKNPGGSSGVGVNVLDYLSDITITTQME